MPPPRQASIREPAQAVFKTVGLSLADWWLAAALASSVLLLEEARKLLMRLARGRPTSPG